MARPTSWLTILVLGALITTSCLSGTRRSSRGGNSSEDDDDSASSWDDDDVVGNDDDDDDDDVGDDDDTAPVDGYHSGSVTGTLTAMEMPLSCEGLVELYIGGDDVADGNLNCDAAPLNLACSGTFQAAAGQESEMLLLCADPNGSGQFGEVPLYGVIDRGQGGVLGSFSGTTDIPEYETTLDVELYFESYPNP